MKQNGCICDFGGVGSSSEDSCEAVCATIDALNRSKDFLNRLGEEVAGYSRTQYGG